CSSGEWGADCASCCHCGEGTCHPLTGECSKGCAECWLGSNCQTKKENCHARPSAQCAPNAISFTDYDRCGEPLQRCQCLAGFKGDGYKTCHGDGVTECVASFLFPSDSHQPLPKSKTSKVLWQLKAPMKLFGKTYDKITRGNTFQTLLINGMNSKQEKMTFAQMLYKDMQWGDGAEPCPLEGQQPPYCQKKTRPTERILPPRPTQPIAIPVDAPRIIQPQLVTPHSGKHNIHVNAQPE
ncbi:hypothetical protein TELCIR_20088, partial [Teladorsagia circumcincta]